jgi:DNA (cytosine-5)-methyltransferase 1
MSAVTGFVAAAALAFTPIQVDGLFVDGFAGGGGASTGIEEAIGRSVDIAVNHSPAAIAIHAANHPGTRHFCQDIKAVWPLATTRMQPVAGAWFSPDCKEFSKAKGGPVKDRSIRALCWEVVVWLKDVRPTCGYLENVEEFEYAAPLDDDGNPIKGQEGREFKRFVRAIRGLGYRVEWKVLRACDYGVPTSRKRLYMVMRCDGLPIVWPKPTHGAPDSPAVRSGKLLPYRTAAECIDWSIDCPSIFARKRELADATKRRIAAGVMRYVVEAARPFIVPVTHQGGVRVHSVDDPARTVTGAHRGELAVTDVRVTGLGQPDSAWQPVTAPHITKFRGGSVGSAGDVPMPTVTANGQSARPAGACPLGMVEASLAFIDRQFGNSAGTSALDPLGATTAGGGGKSAAVTALLSSFYGSDHTASGGEPLRPLRTARAGGQHHAIVTAHIEQANTGAMLGRSPGKPLTTVTRTGSQQRLVETTMVEEGDLPADLLNQATRVAAFLVKYYGTDGESEAAQSQPADRPLDTITTKARFAVVTVTIDARTYVIVDIGLRMLRPRELARAQGFPDSYILDPECWYTTKSGRKKFGRLPLAEQISAIGNSVCPPMARTLVLANQPCNRPTRLAA